MSKWGVPPSEQASPRLSVNGVKTQPRTFSAAQTVLRSTGILLAWIRESSLSFTNQRQKHRLLAYAERKACRAEAEPADVGEDLLFWRQHLVTLRHPVIFCVAPSNNITIFPSGNWEKEPSWSLRWHCYCTKYYSATFWDTRLGTVAFGPSKAFLPCTSHKNLNNVFFLFISTLWLRIIVNVTAWNPP